MGTVLDALVRLGYYNNTMTWFSTDNGPEINCPPEGRCGSGSSGVIPAGTLHRPACGGAGSAGPLRGRKRDVWEGGHRVPGIISWPAVVAGPPRTSWSPVVSFDFLATMLDVLQVQRPPAQRDWAFDGVSVMPILRGEAAAERGVGWGYYSPLPSAENGYAFRYGKYKYVVGGISCNAHLATFNCSAPQLYDMEADFGETTDLAAVHPDILAGLAANFSKWNASIWRSITEESKCAAPAPTPTPVPFPPNPAPSSNCTFFAGKALNGEEERARKGGQRAREIEREALHGALSTRARAPSYCAPPRLPLSRCRREHRQRHGGYPRGVLRRVRCRKLLRGVRLHRRVAREADMAQRCHRRHL